MVQNNIHHKKYNEKTAIMFQNSIYYQTKQDEKNEIVQNSVNATEKEDKLAIMLHNNIQYHTKSDEKKMPLMNQNGINYNQKSFK